MQGVQILSLVEELRSHLPHAQEPKQKQKQYCNKFNKNFKNGPRQKICICFRKKKELRLQLNIALQIPEFLRLHYFYQ